MKKPVEPTWNDVIATSLVMGLCGVFGANIVGQFTATYPYPHIAFALSALAFVTTKNKLWKIDLLLIRRIVLFVGVTTMISGAITWNPTSEISLQRGLQTVQTHIISLVALLATLYIHYVKKGFDFKPRIYVLRNGQYKRVIGPTELIDSIGGIGGYVVIGDKIEIRSGIYFSGNNEIGDESLNGFEVAEMILSPLDGSDMSNLGIT